MSGLILRHALRFGYLSPRFKIVVMVFGVLSLIIIIFSLYLMGGAGGGEIPSSGGSSGDFNF